MCEPGVLRLFLRLLHTCEPGLSDVVYSFDREFIRWVGPGWLIKNEGIFLKHNNKKTITFFRGALFFEFFKVY